MGFRFTNKKVKDFQDQRLRLRHGVFLSKSNNDDVSGWQAVTKECGATIAGFVMGGMALPLDGGNPPFAFVSGAT